MDSPGPKEQGVALGRRVWPSQPRGTRGFTGSGRAGGGADDSGGRAGGCARAQLGEGRGRRAEKSVLGRLLARFTLECFASVIIRVSESPDGRPDPSGQRSIGGSRAWGSAGRRCGGCRSSRLSGTCGPRRHPAFQEGFGARRVCRAEPALLFSLTPSPGVSVPGGRASCVGWTRTPAGLEARGPQALLHLPLVPSSSSGADP